MKRLTIITFTISLVLAIAAGVIIFKSDNAYSDPLSSPGTLNLAHYKLENEVNNCSACHKSAWQGIQNSSCTGCHNRADFERKPVRASTVFHLKLDLEKENCTTCHTEHKGFRAKITKPLDHQALQVTKDNDCDTCHVEEKQKHLQAKSNSYNGKCSTCHNNKAWKPAEFKHVLLENDQLKDCTGCHTQDKTVHLDKNQQNLYNSECSNCHTFRDWKAKVFNHDSLSSKVLNDCISCHTKERLIHTDAKGENIYGDSCGFCHGTEKWKPAQLNVVSILTDPKGSCETCHSGKLPPKHIEQYGTVCSTCHQSYGWLKVSLKHDSTMQECLQCHRKPATTVHQNSFGQCSNCHFTSRWQPTNFSHSAVNQGAKCIVCHQRQSAVHNGTYGTDCAVCHRTTAWKLAVFKHPLGVQDCSKCHKAPLTSNHKAVSQNCVACHVIADWKQVNFDHQQISSNEECLSCHRTEQTYHLEKYMVRTDCQQCHNTVQWKPALFSHDNLQGQACTACHVEPNVSYHRNLGANCQDCHTTKAWRPAKFNHDPYGPIPSNHTQTCTSCHM